MRVSVIGAGIAGLTCALELAERGVAVEVLEREPAPPARNCSWFAGGMLAPWCERESAEPSVVERGQLALDWWPRRFPETVQHGTLVVAYAATPRKGFYFLEPDEHVPARPRQAWTQCQEEDARHIFPCHDKPHVKMTTEVRASVPSGFSVLSNGELVGREPGEGGVDTFHWRMNDPHPSYLVTIVAGEFAVFGDRVTALLRTLSAFAA